MKYVTRQDCSLTEYSINASSAEELVGILSIPVNSADSPDLDHRR
jgi:hypothetical protein